MQHVKNTVKKNKKLPILYHIGLRLYTYTIFFPEMKPENTFKFFFFFFLYSYFCSFDLCYPIIQKDNFIEHLYIVLTYLTASFFSTLFVLSASSLVL